MSCYALLVCLGPKHGCCTCAHLPRSVSSTKRLLSVSACYVFLVRVYYLMFASCTNCLLVLVRISACCAFLVRAYGLMFSSTCLRLTLRVSSTNCLLVLLRIFACCVFLVRVYCLMFSST